MARKALGKKGSKFVAIKLIADHYVGDDRYARMFRSEAELAAVLSHANIVQVFDEGEEDGRSFLIMEWVDGLNLLKLGAVLSLLDDEHRRFRVVSYIIGQLLHALNYAHSITSFDGSPLGVVHRDVSPQNVLVSNHGEVKLTDFGVAYHNFEESSGIHVKGKVRYMSPEQLAGKTRSPTVDLYAVGALLHELLDGKKFRGELEDGQELFTTVLSGHVAPLSRPAPPELERLRLALLQPDATQRLQTAEDAIAMLKRYPGYGDARDELTKLCGSLTGVVKPRVGPGQSGQIEAADQRTTQWGGRKRPLATPRVNVPTSPPPAPSRAASAPMRPTGSITAIKASAAAQAHLAAASEALITGQTEFVQPQSLALLDGPTVPLGYASNPSHAPTVSVRPAELWNSAPPPANGAALAQLPARPVLALPPADVMGAPGAVMPQGSSPIPTYVGGQPSHAIPVQPSGQPWLAATERLVTSETSGASAYPGTEVLDASMLMDNGVGSGTEQEIWPPRLPGDGTDTSRVRPGMPTRANDTVSIMLPKRSAVAAIGVGLVMVAVMSVGVTVLLFSRDDGIEVAAGTEAAASVAGAAEQAEAAEAKSEASEAGKAVGEEDAAREVKALVEGEGEGEGEQKQDRDAEDPDDGQDVVVDEASDEGVDDDQEIGADAGTEEEDSPDADEPAAETPKRVVSKSGEEDEKPQPSKPVVKTSVSIGGSSVFDKAQVKIAGKVGGMGSTLKVPVGRKSVSWRKNPKEPWRFDGMYPFEKDRKVTIFITPGGLNFK